MSCVRSRIWTWASSGLTARPPRSGPLPGPVLSAWLRISIESTPATAPRSSTTGPYWASSASRSESASRSTSSISSTGSARERSSSVTRSPSRARSDEPAERASLVVHQQRVGDLRVGELRARLGRGLARAHERRPPQVHVAHALKREPLERPVGAHEVLHERVRRLHQELGGRRVLGELAALLHDRDAVAHLDRLVDVVSHEDDRLADLALEAQELVLEALAVDRVDGAEGLVHQHQRRVHGQRARHPDPLPLAARELRRDSGRESRCGSRLTSSSSWSTRARMRSPVPAEQARDGGDVVGHGEVREEANLLDRVADVSPQLRRAALAHALAVEQDVPVGDVDHAVDHPHRRGLAAAGRAHQHADLTGRDGQRELLHRGLLLPGVALRRLAELQRGCRRARRRPRGLGGDGRSQRGRRVPAGALILLRRLGAIAPAS